jgi:L-alanine-DL-glutamate epimerase-like enolase superfamily enzyme
VRTGDHYVFGTPLGQRIGSINYGYTRACERAGFRGLYFHDLRREAASRWLERGVPLNVIQVLLGHSKLSQTSTYLGVSEAGVFEAMQRLWTPAIPIASDCMSGQETPPQSATNGADEEEETAEFIEEPRSGDDWNESRNRSAAYRGSAS